MRLPVLGALGFLLGAALLAFSGGVASAQVVGTSRTKIPQDPAAIELNRLLTAAQDAVSKNDYASAAQDYRDYLAKKPDDAVVHYDLGYAYTALQKPAEAKSEYEKAIALDPKMAAAYQNLGVTLIPTDPAGAIEPLQHAAQLMPEDARTKWLLGVALEATKNDAAAIEQYQAAVKLDAKSVEIRNSLGFALLRAGRAGEAEAAFREALSLLPAGQPAGAAANDAHKGLLQALLAEKKNDEAAAEMGVYLAGHPHDASMELEHASLLVEAGKDDEALVELDKAASAGPESLRALKLRALIYFNKKQYDNAVPVLVKAIALAPQDAELTAQLGHAYLERKDYPNAVPVLVAALNKNQQNIDVLKDLVAAEYLNKNYPAALHGLDVLAQKETLPMGSWFVRATCYDKLGQAAPALDAYKKFLEMNKDENSDMYFEATARVRTLTRELANHKR
ncbi:MAG: tetratricopeptide repeat protein [Candidatus Acidiferrales bacterium]|jgi:Flp pilus assembly protein TadD